MTGVGLSQNADTRTAVREAVERTRFAGHARWILALAGRRHRPEDVYAEIRAHFPDVPVYGGSCPGAMTGARGVSRIGCSGYEIALGIFEHGAPEAYVAEAIEGRETEAGRAIGRWLAERPAAGALLFYDVTRECGGINIGSNLLDGVYENLAVAERPALFGAGLIADFQVTGSYLFAGGGARKNVAVALRLPEELEVHTRIMHGCTPVSGHMTVTRAEGARIYELDGEPAVHVLRRLARAQDDEELALAFSVLLGRRAGDPMAPYAEAEYINRLIIDTDAREGWVSLFEEDIRTGDRVQVMVRNNSFLMESVQSGVQASLAATAHTDRLFGLYIDCAGRASVFTGSESEESEHVLKAVTDFPVLGLYVGREIAPFAGRSRPLDWTGVLVIVSRRSPAEPA